MVPHHKEVRKVPIKKIGLDINSINSEELEKLAILANEEINKELAEKLPLSNDYIITSSVELHKDSLTIAFDVLLQSGKPITPEESALIDEAIDKGMKVIEYELARKHAKNKD